MNQASAAPRVVLDTNVLIAAVRSRRSSSRRIIEACCDGRLKALVSGPLLGEYDFIRSRALRGTEDGGLLDELLRQARRVDADAGQHPVPEDPDDSKVLATAADGGADVLVTNDRHLLRFDPYGALRIMRPADAWDRFGEPLDA